jgi:hypothetical protein
MNSDLDFAIVVTMLGILIGEFGVIAGVLVGDWLRDRRIRRRPLPPLKPIAGPTGPKPSY